MRATVDEYRRRPAQEPALRARASEAPEAGRSVARNRHEPAGSGALEELTNEHQAICRLIARCDTAAREQREESEDVRRLIERLESLMQLEERVLHPALAEQASFRAEVETSQVEHRVMRLLLGDLAAAAPRGPRRRATLRVLARLMRQHMEEEVYQFFPRLARSEVDLDALADEVHAVLAVHRPPVEPRLRTAG